MAEAVLEELTGEELGPLTITAVAREVQRISHMESFVGPLPPPAVLERYQELYPDAARVIF